MTGGPLEDVFARLEAAGGTDEEAWAAVREYLHATARRFVAGGDVDDVVQTVLLKLQAPDALRKVRAAGSPAGYLAVMLRNAFVDLLRGRREHEEGALVEHADEAPSQAERLESAERNRRLASFAGRLSDADRELLRLRYWEDLSIREIAERKGLKYSAVAVRLFRILGRLRSLIGPDAELWLPGGQPR